MIPNNLHYTCIMYRNTVILLIKVCWPHPAQWLTSKTWGPVRDVLVSSSAVPFTVFLGGGLDSSSSCFLDFSGPIFTSCSSLAAELWKLVKRKTIICLYIFSNNMQSICLQIQCVYKKKMLHFWKNLSKFDLHLLTHFQWSGTRARLGQDSLFDSGGTNSNSAEKGHS